MWDAVHKANKTWFMSQGDCFLHESNVVRMDLRGPLVQLSAQSKMPSYKREVAELRAEPKGLSSSGTS